MNCKAGDIAYVIKDLAIPTCSGKKVLVKYGTIVKVVYLISMVDKHWQLQDALHTSVTCGCGKQEYELESLPDSLLKPINPISDDAVDETLSWVPVPTKEPTEVV